MEMEEWMNFTAKVLNQSTLQLTIPYTIVKLLKIEPGSLVEVKIKNTGQKIEKIKTSYNGIKGAEQNEDIH